MAAPPASDDMADTALTLKDRFLAWWEGYDLSHRRRSAGVDGGLSGHSDSHEGGQAGAAGRHTNRRGKPLWSPTRIQVVEKIWGEGFSSPGGEEFIPTIVKPLGLNPAMSVLDIGAGLGGASRVMAQQYGTWVTGVEPNPVLAEAGMMRSQKAGLARQAPVQTCDMENFSWTKRVDAVFSKEAFYTVRNKDGMIDAIEAALKPRGQLLFTDYVIERDQVRGRDYDGWLAAEPVEPCPWTVEQYVSALAQRNIELRIAEDNSDTQRSLILNAIQNLVRHLETVSMERETKLAVVEEVEMWARRVAALSSGLRYYRFYAMKPPELA
ncbi:SAM-dependent methyltransferase [Niveispirillum irakense]|uniref:SAM-dependent methyltransferase n=1 Tax=Niveispirillum irakense TaxID=34011 RepID=UPI000402A23A|nr:methyltransferase domain-containing protein [Niveispirillum irakense]